MSDNTKTVLNVALAVLFLQMPAYAADSKPKSEPIMKKVVRAIKKPIIFGLKCGTYGFWSASFICEVIREKIDDED